MFGKPRNRPEAQSAPQPQAPRRAGLLAPIAGLLAGVILLVFSGVLFVWAQVYGPGPQAMQGRVTQVTFPMGTSVSNMGRLLQDQGVIRSALAFRVLTKLDGRGSSLKAGTYEFASGASLSNVVQQIHDGKVIRAFVTIPEGRTSAQAVRILMAVPDLIGEIEVPPEGALLPETYQYTPGETRQAVLDRMLAAGRKTLDELWETRAPDLPFKTKEEALILASVVEKETGIASERPRVAAVFVNRMRNRMRLQSDPTVIYGVSQGEPLGRGLRRSELDRKTPWNTYQIDGLPLTPIANPGRAAIEAVLNPPATDDLYFVADGTGGHVFAPNYEQHLMNVANWRRVERDAAADANADTSAPSALSDLSEAMASASASER